MIACLFSVLFVCGCCQDTLDLARLRSAFASVESTHNSVAKGDWVGSGTSRKFTAYGLYQFHQARWKECGGDPKKWSCSSIAEQNKVMDMALRRYLKSASHLKSVREKVMWMANAHNIGHGCSKDTVYVRKIWKSYSENL